MGCTGTQIFLSDSELFTDIIQNRGLLQGLKLDCLENDQFQSPISILFLTLRVHLLFVTYFLFFGDLKEFLFWAF